MNVLLGPPPQTPAVESRPLHVAFLVTSLPVGGAETLLASLVRGLDRSRIAPEIVCLKAPGPLGEELAREVPLHANLIRHKYDAAVVWRLARLFRRQRIDCVITVGAGDKMFWGRLAAKAAGVSSVLSALHSTGWPDGVGRLNRWLTPITDRFIAVAPSHARFLCDSLKLSPERVVAIPNGIDTARFSFDAGARQQLRRELAIEQDAPVTGIVAALRPEKNHELFLQTAALVVAQLPRARFLIVGDGPRRRDLEKAAGSMGLGSCVQFLGSRGDIPQLLSTMDLFALTSHNEANPVSILEAMACRRPVVAPRVGSIAESVEDGVTGFLYDEPRPTAIARRWLQLLEDSPRAAEMGFAARDRVLSHGSLESMTLGYERLIFAVHSAKTLRRNATSTGRSH
jgi:glycosyltransferase involved in cell wall biosynthesis